MNVTLFRSWSVKNVERPNFASPTSHTGKSIAPAAPSTLTVKESKVISQ